MIFSAVDFPEPLAPRMILVWPVEQREADVLQHHLVVERELHLSKTMTGAPASSRIC